MEADVVLRPLTRADVPAVWEAVRESRSELAPWMPWCTPEYDESGVLAFVEATTEKRTAGVEFDFGIFSQDGIYLGNCALNGLNLENRYANLGYWIRTSRTRRGFATRAVQKLARWAFENTSLDRLEILVAVENRASLVVAARAGAAREGILRNRLVLGDGTHDAAVFSLVRGDRLRRVAEDDGLTAGAGSGKRAVAQE